MNKDINWSKGIISSIILILFIIRLILFINYSIRGRKISEYFIIYSNVNITAIIDQNEYQLPIAFQSSYHEKEVDTESFIDFNIIKYEIKRNKLIVWTQKSRYDINSWKHENNIFHNDSEGILYFYDTYGYTDIEADKRYRMCEIRVKEKDKITAEDEFISDYWLNFPG